MQRQPDLDDERPVVDNAESPAPPVDHLIPAVQAAARNGPRYEERFPGENVVRPAVKEEILHWRTPIQKKLLPILRPFKPMCMKELPKTVPKKLTHKDMVKIRQHEQKVKEYDARILDLLSQLNDIVLKPVDYKFLGHEFFKLNSKIEDLPPNPRASFAQPVGHALDERFPLEAIESFFDEQEQKQQEQQPETALISDPLKEKKDEIVVTPLNPEEIYKNECLEVLKVILPIVEADWLKKCVEQRFADKWDLVKTTSWIFDNLNVAPRKEQVAGENQLKEVDMEAQRARLLDTVREVDNSYRVYGHLKLSQKFNRIAFDSLRLVQRHFKFMYLPSIVLLAEAICAHFDATNTCWYDYQHDDLMLVEVIRKKEKLTIPLRINDGVKNYSRKKFNVHKMPDILRMEVEWAERYIETIERRYERRRKQQMIERKRALTVKAAVERGDALECQLCWEYYVADDESKCQKYHKFCGNCLRRQCYEVVNGNVLLSVEGDVPCMGKNCSSIFTDCMLQKCLSPEMHAMVDDRRRSEMLTKIADNNLSKCPFCQYAIFIEVPIELNKVFKCGNPLCKRETCRRCQADWKPHEGVPCKEMETDDEEMLRKKYEALLSLKKIRVCHRCGTPLVKADGCNKMTCRCGAKLCYLCRAKDIDYDHFCRHPLNPGEFCRECNNCKLFEDAENFDARQQNVINEDRQAEEWRMALQNAPRIPKKTAAQPAPAK